MSAAPQVSATGCYQCPQRCMTCSQDRIELNSGYSLFLEDTANASDVWHAFTCPVPEACPKHGLLTHGTETRSSASNCTEGHTGRLCANCVAGWKRGPTGTCQRCNASSSGALNPLLLIPAAIVLCYVALRLLLTFRRSRRLRKAEAAAELFDDMDSDDSGAITVAELRVGLASLGLHMNEDGVRSLMGTVVTDTHGCITKDEFVACKSRCVFISSVANTCIHVRICAVSGLLGDSRSYVCMQG